MIMHRPDDLLVLFEHKLQAEIIRKEPQSLYDPANYILSLGGKRIRPVMLLMSCELFGGRAEMALDAAMGIEMFHNFSLVHDDIMDRAPMRRGKPTVHEKWNANTAILSGDTMLVLAYRYFQRLSPHIQGPVLNVFSQTAMEVCEGQQYDMDFESDDRVSLEEYLEMIRLKTAVLLAASYKIGAIIAGADSGPQEDLYDFGLMSGMAFQLKDDLLDTYGDEKTFGKRIYGDILANKKTFLYLKALELANPQQKDILYHHYSGKSVHPEEKVKAVLTVFNQLDVQHHTENKILEYYQKALDRLEHLEAGPGNKMLVREYTSKLMGRSH